MFKLPRASLLALITYYICQMKFIQITDLHIDIAGGCPFDIDVRKNFFDILDAVMVQQPEHLIVTGDLCYRRGEDNIYRWIRAQLDQ